MTFTITVSLYLFAALTALALVWGALYAWALNHQLRWLADDATELSVVIGVLVTLLIWSPLLGPHLFALLVWAFGTTGIWQMWRSAHNRHVQKQNGAQAVTRAVEEARRDGDTT